MRQKNSAAVQTTAPTDDAPEYTAASQLQAPVTVITATQPQRLAKRFSIQDGQLKKHSAGNVAAGRIALADARTPAALAELLQGLGADQALIFGLPIDPDARQVVSKSQIKKMAAVPAGTIARLKDNFRWHAGPGWLMLDYDPPPDGEAEAPESWREMLYAAAPQLRDAPHVWTVSASSEIWNRETSEQLQGITGQRLYVLVQDARDIPRAGAALFDRLCLLGHGYCQVSKAGALLERGPIDKAVWQTNRLDFAAPPVCEPPLEARRPAPEVFNDDAQPLDLAGAIVSLSHAEQKRLADVWAKEKALDAVQTERAAAQQAWIEERLSALPPETTEEQRESARVRLQSAVVNKRLFGDFELVHSSGRTVTVGAVLDDPERWHGECFADPLEPDYGNGDKRIAWLNLRSGGTPYIRSHAHGGQRFRLLRAVARLELDPGEGPRAVSSVCERLLIEGDVFERAGELVRLSDGALIPVNAHWLQTRIESCFEIWKYDKRARQQVRADCPKELAQRVIAAAGGWGLPRVTGLVYAPVLRPDGSLLIEPGFDAATGLLFLDDAEQRPTPRALNRAELSSTLARIWEPFALFPFADDLSRGVFLAALLTTACRATLPKAPAFLIAAHAPGTGKSLLAECLLQLQGGTTGAMVLPEKDDAETEKRLAAKLRAGHSGIFLDNVQGNVDQASLCAFLTSAEPEFRILGKSEVVRVSNRALWVLTGNNITATGDTFRRILPVALDANVENPEARRFTFDPKALIASRLDAYRADLLSVLLSFVEAGTPCPGAGGMGSFEDWERLVRQCVCWLIEQGAVPVPMEDPAGVLRVSRAEDPERLLLASLLESWFDHYGSSTVEVREIAGLLTGHGVHEPGLRHNAKEAALCEAVLDVAEVRGSFSAKSLGRYLRRNAGVVASGLRVDAARGGRVVSWRVTQASADHKAAVSAF